MYVNSGYIACCSSCWDKWHSEVPLAPSIIALGILRQREISASICSEKCRCLIFFFFWKENIDWMSISWQTTMFWDYWSSRKSLFAWVSSTCCLFSTCTAALSILKKFCGFSVFHGWLVCGWLVCFYLETIFKLLCCTLKCWVFILCSFLILFLIEHWVVQKWFISLSGSSSGVLEAWHCVFTEEMGM